MPALSLKGVLLGGITDIVATAVTAFPLTVVAAARANAENLPMGEQTRTLLSVMQGSAGIRIAGWLLGGLCSVLGGYVAARLAKRGEMLNGALSAFFCVGLGLYSLATASPAAPFWQHLASFAISPALGAIGGYLRLRQTSRPVHPSAVTPLPA